MTRLSETPWVDPTATTTGWAAPEGAATDDWADPTATAGRACPRCRGGSA